MSACPKCGKKLRIFDISQFCPACGVNMRFVNFEENFLREAKLAELSQAELKVKLRNLRYSFSGSKWITAKLVVMLLPVLSLLIPSGNFSVSMPFLTNMPLPTEPYCIFWIWQALPLSGTHLRHSGMQ